MSRHTIAGNYDYERKVAFGAVDHNDLIAFAVSVEKVCLHRKGMQWRDVIRGPHRILSHPYLKQSPQNCDTSICM